MSPPPGPVYFQATGQRWPFLWVAWPYSAHVSFGYVPHQHIAPGDIIHFTVNRITAERTNYAGLNHRSLPNIWGVSKLAIDTLQVFARFEHIRCRVGLLVHKIDAQVSPHQCYQNCAQDRVRAQRGWLETQKAPEMKCEPPYSDTGD